MASKLDGIADWDDRARQARYDVRKVAAHCGVTPRRLEQHFHRTLRLCPRAWIHALRMRDARRLLLQGMTTKEVAFELGYEQVNSFCRAFRHAVGCCPRFFVHQSRTGGVVLHVEASISQNAHPSRLVVTTSGAYSIRIWKVRAAV